ncbi:MAG: hypothetical protein HFJ45_05050 [Clostridia bacterium]|nr:hypothetical protein [Clostridia bacterium]
MITEYDISTKDKEVSYIEFVDMILDRLGFRRNNVGTRFLREFVIYLYKKNPFEIIINNEIEEFLTERNIKNLTIINFIKRINYAIKYADTTKMKENFFNVFHTQFDYYYLTPKTFIILMLNVLEKVVSINNL